MAHIKKMTDKFRTLPWRAHINRRGRKPLVKMFLTRDEAEAWAGELERSIRLYGLPMTNNDLKNITVADIVKRYLKEVTPSKGSCVSEATMLSKLLRRDISHKSLAYVSRQDAHKYIDDRLRDTWRGDLITPRTVRREINSIQHIFEVAIEKWGYTNLGNPFKGIKMKGTMYRRNRRLKDGELQKLDLACKLCRGPNQYYVHLAIYLAIETGMRLQEIFNLRWSDINRKESTIDITKSKTDNFSEHAGRTIVLTMKAGLYLGVLSIAIKLQDYSSNALLFPMTKDAFKQSWADVVKRAGISDLTFHDLRREAGSRFDEAGLTKAEHDLMMGHKNGDMTSLYIHADLKRIRDKLDRMQDDLDTLVPDDEFATQLATLKRVLGNMPSSPLSRPKIKAMTIDDLYMGIPDRTKATKEETGA